MTFPNAEIQYISSFVETNTFVHIIDLVIQFTKFVVTNFQFQFNKRKRVDNMADFFCITLLKVFLWTTLIHAREAHVPKHLLRHQLYQSRYILFLIETFLNKMTDQKLNKYILTFIISSTLLFPITKFISELILFLSR